MYFVITHYWIRFLVVWAVFTLLNFYVVFKATRKPLANTTPRLESKIRNDNKVNAYKRHERFLSIYNELLIKIIILVSEIPSGSFEGFAACLSIVSFSYFPTFWTELFC